jgi:tRNA/tmRNA/rRNA uracil-C5-methylase (TrmA/RlmC/RlmD family)
VVRLEVGSVAHGGHCVARHEGRVVFVRHALPGEVVLARLLEAGPEDRFWRADAVEVLEPSPDRVAPRCPVSGPGGCGGCDFQHVSTDGQRRLKATVVTEQLERLGKVTPDELAALTPGTALEVEPVSGDDDGLAWRTRVRFAVDGKGRPGLRRYRSHEVVPLPGGCPLCHPRVAEPDVTGRRWPGAGAVEVVAPAAGTDRLVVVEPERDRRVEVPPLAAEAATAQRDRTGLRRLRGRTWVQEQVEVDGDLRLFRVTGGGFWQVHPGAAQALLDTVLAAADPRPGERVLDLYSGSGLFSAGLAERVGVTGTVLAVESDDRAAADARRSLHDLPQVQLEHGRVDRVLGRMAADPESARVDVVVLDPPRAGAGREVVGLVTALAPRVLVYVACDPAALGRDVATARAHGYRLSGLRAFDLFPMTHHVECVATFTPSGDLS